MISSSSSSSSMRRRRKRIRRNASSLFGSSSSSSSSSSSVGGGSVIIILSRMIFMIMMMIATTLTTIDSSTGSTSAATAAAAAAEDTATMFEDHTLPDSATAATAAASSTEQQGSCVNENSNNTDGANVGSCDGSNDSSSDDRSSEKNYGISDEEEGNNNNNDNDNENNIPPELVVYKDRWVGCEDYERVWEEYEQVEEYQTLQQSVDVYYSEQSDDGCLFLHGYLHMCASNRPHYHEPFVHYPGRFLSTVERVLFIGGGDSMVLHEVLKYPSVQLVVGLELDQSVVRTSFQFFGTQPHWDDDRVEWYFGDGAKSLNLLPRNYFGTFDLVVVDILSPIAQSLKVNDELTVMEALMLLLKPEGIIVKNEDEGYIPGANTANFTTHSVEIMFHDVPIYCLQTFVVGTNSNTNFQDAVPRDHGVETKYLKNVDEFQSQFDSYYTSNDKNLLDVLCERPRTSSSSSSSTSLPTSDEKKSDNGEEEEEDDEDYIQTERRDKQEEEEMVSDAKMSETNSTDTENEDEESDRLDWSYMKLVKWQAPIGLNMILEAEMTMSGDNSKFKTSSDIISTFRPILTSDELGLIIIDTNELELTRDEFTANIVTFVFDQGYVVVRCVPALSYCGFDIQLWADFNKHPQIKAALLSGVGSTATNISQFRVVTSGMIDAKNEQAELTGPPSVRDYCDSKPTPEKTESYEDKGSPTSSLTVELANTPLNEREFRNLTLHSYDATSKSARDQWSSQRSIGVQTISQFEETKGTDVSLSSVITILKKSIELHNNYEQNDDDDDDDDEVIESHAINDFSGKGSIVIVSWSKGQAIVLWDGDGRVDVNWFVFGVDTDIPDSLMAAFDNALSMLLAFTAIVRDEIPRGIGRIIDFYSEFENREEVDPLWF